MLYWIKLLTIALCMLPLLAQAEEQEYVELQSRCTKMHIDYVVHDDFTVEKISELEFKALNETAADNLKKRSFSYSTSVEKLEVLEAYTNKSDGSHIDVPKNNYQVTINKGKGENGPVFSDRTRLTIIFPDFEVQDSVHLKLKNIETKPMFPGHFSTSGYFWSQMAYDDVKVTFNVPEDMVFQHQVRGMKEKTTHEKGRKLIELTYSAVKPVKIKRKDFSVWDEEKEAGYALSTFMDYETMAKAYGVGASPKSIPTDRVKKLAQKIIDKEKDKKEQARLLYEWVATNISYGGNCIGVGAVIPHDTDFILDNRMGDCKDHATLLEALYTTVGIESSQALIHAGTTYSLPRIPRVAAVNHIITYIPVWNRFVDSTNPSMPFNRLAFPLSDKPVILVKQYKPGLRTPATRIGDNHQEVVSVMKIQDDGSVEGTIQVASKGHPAIAMRQEWRHITREQEKQWLEYTFSSQNKIGSATMKKDDPVPLMSEFNYSIEFDKPEFLLPAGTGGFYIRPLVPTAMEVAALVHYANEEIEGYDVACSNGYSLEQLQYEFPPNMKILALPNNFEIDENHIYFKATYDIEGNTLQVVREMNDKTPGNVCSAVTINNQRQTLIKIANNLKSQVVYQHDASQ